MKMCSSACTYNTQRVGEEKEEEEEKEKNMMK